MQAILQATSGPAAGTKILVRPGQHVQVGRTRWADYSVPDDPALSDVHFAIHCGAQGCRIRDLNSGTGTLVNGAKVKEGPLHTGDQITAGQTTFSVIVEGELAAGLGPATPGDAGQNQPPPARSPTAADYCGNIELSEPARPLLQEGIAPAAFLDLLVAQQLFPDALRFLAAWLPKPTAIAWGCSCLRSAFGEACPPGEKAAIEAAQQWADDPTEDHRRATWAAAETAGFDTAAGLLALGAFSSGGSLAPPGVDPVPPAEGITAQMTAAALTIAATQGPARPDERPVSAIPGTGQDATGRGAQVGGERLTNGQLSGKPGAGLHCLRTAKKSSSL